MKKVALCAVFVALFASPAMAVCTTGCVVPTTTARDVNFKSEVAEGLDVTAARANAGIFAKAPAPGQLGAEVYITADAAKQNDYQIYIPPEMYVRGGGGYTLGFLSGHARSGFGTADISDGYAVIAGLGWNISSFARAEIGFQHDTLHFNGVDAWAVDPANLRAVSNAGYAMWYFDLRRRFVPAGDIIRRRTIVPYIGLGVVGGEIGVDDTRAYTNGSPPAITWMTGSDSLFVAPRAEVGLNIMLTDFWGIDIAYQYQYYFTNNGFGWGDLPGLYRTGQSNIMASLRVNF
ncbi:MAG: hypothetical protein FWC51_02085 [Proteobacteria bacterium]|nr:hypothetical protein [Pseudomonadota bacterium]